MLTNYQVLYKEKIYKDLQDRFNYKNPMQVPKIVKVTINMGLGKDAVADSKVVKVAFDELTLIAGQRPVVTKAKKSIAGFKLREGQAIGCKVTLRGKIMYEFLERLTNIALPRVRDFRGLSGKGFDGRGNFSMGLKEQIVFPEIEYDKIDKIRGMDVTVVTSTDNDDEARELLKGFNFPFIEKRTN